MKTSDLHRPTHIQNEIDKVFGRLNKTESLWTRNGQNVYEFFNVQETYLLQYLINNTGLQKEFSVLEVGAGDFQFGRNMVKFINSAVNKHQLCKSIKVNVISLRGEGGEMVNQEIQNCHVTEACSFKIENLIEEFTNKGLEYFLYKFDFIISQYTLMHLVDALGTFLQMHALLKVGGIMLTDTFDFKINGKSCNDCYHGSKIISSYLHAQGEELLITHGKNPLGLPRFAIKKHVDSLRLPFEYSGFIFNDFHGKYCQNYDINKSLIDSADLITKAVAIKSTHIYGGDKSLFKLLSAALSLELKCVIQKKSELLVDALALLEAYNNDPDKILFSTIDDYTSFLRTSINTLANNLPDIEECANGNKTTYTHHFLNYEYLNFDELQSTANTIGEIGIFNSTNIL